MNKGIWNINSEGGVDEGGEPTTTQRYQAWEFYDYSVNIHNNENPPIVSWTRQGSTPPFCTDGNGVTRARGYRVNSFEELPQSTKEYVNENCPLFRGAPQSMEEVDRLLGNIS